MIFDFNARLLLVNGLFSLHLKFTTNYFFAYVLHKESQTFMFYMDINKIASKDQCIFKILANFMETL